VRDPVSRAHESGVPICAHVPNRDVSGRRPSLGRGLVVGSLSLRSVVGGPEGVGDVGAVIMLGTLFGLIALIYGVVLRYDPEARRPRKGEGEG
jgi:hypothetical protein